MAGISLDVSSRQGAWHQSGLDQILDDCARKWALTYELGLPSPPSPATLVGRAYHHGLERYLEARMAGNAGGELDELVEAAGDYVLAGYAELPAYLQVDASCDALVAEVTAALTNWERYPVAELDGLTLRARLEQLEILACEVHHRAPMPHVGKDCLPIGGTFDVLVREGDDVFLIDHKTVRDDSKALGYWRKDDKGLTQATMYAQLCALNPDFPEVARDGRWVRTEFHIARKRASTRSNFIGALAVVRQPTHADVDQLRRRIQAAQRLLVEQAFPRNPASNLCRARWCPHFAGCQGGELAGPWDQVLAGRVRDGLSPAPLAA